MTTNPTGPLEDQLVAALRDICHTRDQLNETIDVETRLFNRHGYADDQPATARALARLGATMAAGKRYDDAQTYLTKADAMFQALGRHDPDIVRSHVHTLVLLILVLKHQGRHSEAAERQLQADELHTSTLRQAGRS